MTFELFFLILTALTVVVVSAVLFLALSKGRPSPAEVSLSEGDFSAVLEHLEDASREELAHKPSLLASRAMAAKHCLRFEEAAADLETIVQADPLHGESWLELALNRTYLGQHESAAEAFSQALRTRADLSESIQLHRAFHELCRGNKRLAHRLFDEIEAPLENKLRQDLGSGEPLFAEWFLHAGALWHSKQEQKKAAWSYSEARSSAPNSLLVDRVEKSSF